MQRLQYIGLKTNGERAFQDRTGIEWMPAAVHAVADDVAAEMLRHPTIWRQVDGGAPLALADARLHRVNSSGVVTDEEVDEAERKATVPPAASERADGNVLVAMSRAMLEEAAGLGLVGTTADGYPLIRTPSERESAPGDAAPVAPVDAEAISLAPGATVAAAPAPATEAPHDPIAGIDVMELEELHALAKSLDVKVHHAAGAGKVRDALRAAFPQPQ